MGGTRQRVVAIGNEPPSPGAGVEVVSSHELTEDALSELPVTDADCVVIDATANETRALSLLEEIHHLEPAPPTVLTTETPDGSLAAAATRCGVTEYVPRTDPESRRDVTLAGRVSAIIEGQRAPPTETHHRARAGAGVSTPDQPTVDTTQKRTTVTEQAVIDDQNRSETESALHETTQALFNADTQAAVAQIVSDAAVDIFEFDLATVRLQDPEAEQLEVAALARDGVESVAEPPPVAPTTEPFGEALERSQAIITDDFSTTIGHEYGPIERGITIPVGSIGVLSGGSTDPSAITESDATLLELLATSAAIALERTERREELVRYEQVLEGVEGMVYALDADGRFKLVTEPLADRLGYDRNELVGEHISCILEETAIREGRDCIRTLLSASDSARTSRTFEATCHTADGSEFPVEIELSVLMDNRRFRGSVGTVRDITERKEREQYLQVLTRVLRHNLRNELTVVEGYSTMLLEELEGHSLAPVAQQLHASATDLSRTSEKARSIERILDRSEVKRRAVNLPKLLTGCLADLDGVSEETDITVDMAPAECEWVRANDGLETALSNLLENAVRHAGPEPTISITASRHGGEIRLEIADDGPGIPQSEVAVVTGEAPISQLTHGNGLGLWLVRWILSANGGEIEFDASELGGSAVTLILEAAEPPADGGNTLPPADD